MKINIVGAGLAGCEAAYYLAKKGYDITLYEMRPKKMTEAHQTGFFAELVCSNSLRSNSLDNAVGILKEEMRMWDSIVMKKAALASVPAGSSLAVDRNLFSQMIENELKTFKNIQVVYDEYVKIDFNSFTIIAAGPLASDNLKEEIQSLFHTKQLHFFDAVAPIIDKDSINMEICYLKSRYDKGEAAYLNCPMTKEQYDIFYEALIQAQTAPIKDFENNVFEGCMPVEVMAKRGKEALVFGPLKPVGLEYAGNKPYAVVQLRQDDAKKTMYNIVGFQTHLTFLEQKRIIQMIPGLEKAHILRYGVMHKNTYLESPNILNNGYQSKQFSKLFFAGQISGVEGYVESAASGLNAAIQLDQYIKTGTIKPLPEVTMMGAMAHYIATSNQSFVPMNANLGLLPSLDQKYKKEIRKQMYAKRALEAMENYIGEHHGSH